MLVWLQQALISGQPSQKARVPGQTIDLITLARQAFSEAVAVVGEKTFPQLHITAVEVVEKAKTKTTQTVPLIYPYQHIWRILHSLFLNSIRATVRVSQERDEEDFAPVSLVIVLSPDDVSLKVSDLGGGIERHRKVFSFEKSQSANPGLPTARVAARYLRGDLSLASLSGLTTEAVLHLKTKPKHSMEYFP